MGIKRDQGANEPTHTIEVETGLPIGVYQHGLAWLGIVRVTDNRVLFEQVERERGKVRALTLSAWQPQGAGYVGACMCS
jgi:hypothetical protein